MANYFYEEQQFDQNLFNQYFDVAPASDLDVLGATFQETLYYNPANALLRLAEQYSYEGRRGQTLTKDEYMESEYYRPGIQVDDSGIKEGLAKLLAERKDKRDSFNIQLNASRGGFGLGAAQFGVGLVGSLLDPLNIASAFIPTLGTARAATLAAKFGKNGGRFMTGVMDGMVGAALLEPLVIGAAAAEQDQDYNLMDSFLNVAFGGALGGGLHVGFGKISDRIERSSHEIKEKATVLAVEQAAGDQDITAGNLHKITENRAADSLIKRSKMGRDFDPSVRAQTDTLDPETGEIISTETIKESQITKPEGVPDPETVLFDAIDDPVYQRKGKTLPSILRPKKPDGLLKFIQKNGGINLKDPDLPEIDAVVGGINARRKVKGLATQKGKTINDMMDLAREAGYFPKQLVDGVDEFTPSQFYNAIAEDVHVGKFSELDTDSLIALERAEELIAMASRYNINPEGMSNGTFMSAINNAMQKQDYYDYNTAIEKDGLTEQQYKDLGDEAAVTNTYLGALRDQKNILDEMEADGLDYQSSELVDILSQNSLLEADLQGFRNANLLPEDLDAEIKASDDLINKADSSYDEAARAGASCLITNMRNLK